MAMLNNQRVTNINHKKQSLIYPHMLLLRLLVMSTVSTQVDTQITLLEP